MRQLRLAPGLHRGRTSTAPDGAVLVGPPRFVERLVLADQGIDLAPIPLVIGQRGLDLDLEEVRMAGSEFLHVATGAAVHADDLPHAETGARHLRLAARGLLGEVNAWTLTPAP